MALQHKTDTISRVAVALLLAALTLGSSLSCKNEMTGPSAVCSLGPYSFDSNVNRCRAYNGQFANNECCGR